MKTILVISILVALITWYALQGRAWLKAQSWTQGFFSLVEPIELFLFKKSETILFARLKMFTGILLMLLSQLGAIDLAPIMPLVPDQYEPYVRIAFNMLPLILTVVGWIDESLRKATTKPIELVAVPEADMTPQVAQAIAVAEVAKEQAVAVVKDEAKGV